MSLTSFNSMIVEDGNSNDNIKVKCSSCGVINTVVKKEYTRTCKRQSEYTNNYLCSKCYRLLNRDRNIQLMKKSWSTNDRKLLAKKASNAFWNSLNKEQRLEHSRKGITQARNDNVSKAIKKKFENKEYKEKQAIARSKMPRLSSIQLHLYKILDDLKIDYIKEGENTRIGFYVFDCIIPRQNGMKKSILIECHGEYWHSLEKSKRNDKAKETFIQNYHSHEYDFKVFWDYDFLFEKKIVSIIQSMCNINNFKQIDFNFDEINVEKCDYKQSVSFLSKYHYLHTTPRGSSYIGAYFMGELIAIFVVSPLIRQNIAQTLNLKNAEVLEISRFCIHPCFQKKNFASWFMKRAIKLCKNIKALIAYADNTCGHSGTIYKASNFVMDRVVRPDYWYVDECGYVMHKKTLYNRAIKMGEKESVYAFNNGFKKVKGKEKYRFVKVLR